MGRRKIDIEFIREDRSRATTFIKRKSGLFKKAHELAILTGAQIAVVVFSQQDRLFTYSNEPCSDICAKFLRVGGDPHEAKGPHDYGTAQDNEEDSDEDAAMQDVTSRRGSIAPQPGKTGSSPLMTLSRKNSVLLSPRTQSPSKTQDPLAKGPAHAVSLKKRGQSPVQDRSVGSPKFHKYDSSAHTSDIRHSYPSGPRPQPSRTSMSSTPPTNQHHQEFSLPSHMSAPMIPPHPSQLYAQSHGPPAYVPQYHQQRSQQQITQDPSYQRQQASAPPVMYQAPENASHQESKPKYAPSTSTRQLPMAPPLTIPSMTSSNQGDQNEEGREQQPRNGQPLLPPGLMNSGPSRVLLPGEGGSTGLTPIESPGNFASTLYASQGGIAEIGTNISIPRISTDVDSLFYNWNTNEPGLSPATSMMLNQFRENPEHVNPPGPQGNPPRGPLTGPPISAGVLENFSPTTAQWLSGHGLPPSTQTDGGRPYC